MDRNLIFQHILTKILFKKCCKNSLQYLENDPLNVLTLVVDRILDRNNFKKYQIIQHICTILTCQYVTKAAFLVYKLRARVGGKRKRAAFSPGWFMNPSELSQDRRQLRHLCPKKDNSDAFPGGFASCLGTTLMSFLVVLPSVLG